MKNWQLLLIVAIFMILIYVFRNKINKPFMFEILIPIILKHEGGYVNDPDDLGGETKYGITKRRYPNLDIKNLTKQQAIEIYKRDFYIPMKVGEVKDINLALHYFDMGVNAGAGTAKKMLIQALEEKEKNGANPVKVFKELRIAYYKRIAELRNNKKFLAGWLNRVENTKII
jgi:lysozyme family protein